MVVGETKDVGFQIGVSKTLPHPAGRVWDLLTGPAGTALWLGEGVRLDGTVTKGDRYSTADGAVGEIRSFHPGAKVRLTCRPAGWDHDTTVQVSVSGTGARCTLRFHQEWLADSAERERQREHWRAALARVEAALAR